MCFLKDVVILHVLLYTRFVNAIDGLTPQQSFVAARRRLPANDSMFGFREPGFEARNECMKAVKINSNPNVRDVVPSMEKTTTEIKRPDRYDSPLKDSFEREAQEKERKRKNGTENDLSREFTPPPVGENGSLFSSGPAQDNLPLQDGYFEENQSSDGEDLETGAITLIGIYAGSGSALVTYGSILLGAGQGGSAAAMFICGGLMFVMFIIFAYNADCKTTAVGLTFGVGLSGLAAGAVLTVCNEAPSLVNGIPDHLANLMPFWIVGGCLAGLAVIIYVYCSFCKRT